MSRIAVWRGLVTFGAALAALGLMRIALPGLDVEELESRVGVALNVANISIGALGVMPLLMAGFLVELGTLWRPAKNVTIAPRPFGFLRGDRGGAPADFAGRARTVYAVTLVLALFQAMGVAYMLRRMELPGYPDSSWLIIATLVGGVFCHAAFARVIDEQGLGSGVIIMFLCNALGDLPDSLRRPDPVAPGLAAFAVAAVATFFILKPSAESAKARVPTLTAGLLSMVLSGYVLALLAAPWASRSLADLAQGLFERMGSALAPAGGFELHSVLLGTALNAAAILAAAIVVSWVVVRPRGLARLWAKATADGDEDSSVKQLRPALWLGIALSSGLSLALSLLDLGSSLLHSSMTLASSGALAAAVVLDVRSGVRTTEANTVIWVDTRLAWLNPIRVALSRAGIQSATLGEAASTLLPLNGPLVATQLLVKSSDAPKASQLIGELLADRTEVVAAPSRRVPVSEPAALPKRPLLATFFALVIGVAMVAWPAAIAIREQLTPPPPGEAATLAFLLVDDETDPLGRWGSGNFTPPPGIEMLAENVPYGERGGAVLRAYAMTFVQGGESSAQAADRLLEFLNTVEVPPRRRWALQALGRYADEEPGWRSFLLKTDTPGPTDGDLRSVDAFPDGPEQLRWMLRLEFTAQGGRLFEELTRANVKRRFAILVNNTVESAPVINQPITGGTAVITMGAEGTHEDATKLRDALTRSIRKR